MAVPLLIMVLLGLMTLPVPPFLLDTLFTFNIALAIIVLLVSIYVMRPLDFAVFPSILLVATLLRLALNVASTRVVLLYGHEGGDAAGTVIASFGEVLIGGNYAVGLVVFAILMIINFVVITKGAGRVSEVSARFTLDAMPGKQMAIDADLNAGLIDADTAKERRAEVTQEADFYGSMDGASKFVRGDAVAGILILLINIVGGVAIGMVQHQLSFGLAMERYALLTIGDGLVAQVPSLLLSVAAAIMVTRNSSDQEIGDQVVSQMFATPKALIIAGIVLTILGSIPGMPHFVFLSLAAIMFALSWLIYKRNQPEAALAGGPTPSGGGGAKSGAPSAPSGAPSPISGVESEDNRELSWEDVQPVDTVGLEVGYRLIPLVDRSQGGQLLARIKGVRKKLSQELGFLMPSIHIRDNLDLMPSSYRITLMGVTIAEAEIHPDRDLAINPGQVFGTLEGIKTQDPAFKLDAIWIETSQKDQAQSLGYTVVDSATVVATHLNQILLSHAAELIGHDEVQALVDQLGKHHQKLAESLVPDTLSVSQLLKVLQNLLLENVSLKDMRSIAEAITSIQPPSTDIGTLTQAVRAGLKRMIVQNIVGAADEIPVMTFDRELEQLLLRTAQQAQKDGFSDTLMIEPQLAEQIQQSVVETCQRLDAEGKPCVLLVSPAIRLMMAKYLRPVVSTLAVLSYQEVPDNKQISVVASIGGGAPS
ncbi:flagellar biosynthesis protein FlhA [Salinibius halmophilus]|uniref:flagellar biosynthesis protein FlhA n=1 Tax=Salinibius halmophilus TaxID=1853216 RepID=UPI001F176A03|nr:flagellar biosynthesis protein FlhA [Salinibius halmophilus]